MKIINKLLLTLLLSFSSMAYGQEVFTQSFITHYTTVEVMRWNTYTNEYDFIPKYDKSRENYSWLITLKSDRSGYVHLDNMDDGEIYGFRVQHWDVVESKSERGAIIMDVTQLSNGEEGTIILQKIDENKYGASIFLPKSKTYLFFETKR
jgi:hypothetical protein